MRTTDMNDPKAMQDAIGTYKSLCGYHNNGIIQEWVPQVNHQRTCYVWSKHCGGYTVVSVNTETLIVRPIIKNCCKNSVTVGGII